MLAIEHANRVIDWQQNCSEDDMPPEWMWPLDEEIVAWFERVADERREKAGKDGSDKRDTVPMMSNDLADGRRGRR